MTGAAVLETHASVLFFLADRVYKLRKPVDLGFLDFTTREARHADCQREVELNRRLAPDVYLGIADVVGVDGELCDHLVVMLRLPEERRLATLVRSGADIERCLRQVAHAVAAFHARARRPPEAAAAAGPDAVLRSWDSNFDQLRPFVGSLLDPAAVDRAEHLAARYLDGRRELFERRAAEGKAVDGHGDLQAEDIFCLDDGPRILDCIQFSDVLRYGDVVADVAFLAMDLERLGATEASEQFVVRYRELSGETFPSSLFHHHVAYRAQVRAEVACLRHAQGHEPSAGEAARLLRQCVQHLEEGRVRLVLVGGLPGTGKSTLASALAEARGWSVLRSDEVRKDLAELGHTTPASAGWQVGIYEDRFTTATYDELLRRARRALTLGESVVLDASWTSRRFRDAATEVATVTSSDLVQLRCEAPRAVAAARMVARRRTGSDPSDADAAVAAAMAQASDPWPEALTIHTVGPPEEALAEACAVA